MTVLAILAAALGTHTVGSLLLVRLCKADDLNPLHHARNVAQRQALTLVALLLILGGTTHGR
ncbi:hypothetical protein ACFYW6_07200 [Streptomyces sp. NPDC002659]|uniref:hypothetical protein n=1 Tax=Streptomyces sp. NPDC002659 TaxID=3364656 RepID=UPI0036AB4123